MTASASPRVPGDRLPSGRRSRATLTRADVVGHQRARLLRAMAEEVAARGYAAVSVAHVIARAGVSRATFYEQFDGKQSCFLAAYDEAVGILLAGADPGLGLDVLLTGYLDALADRPALARVFLLDVYALGPEGVRRRAQSQQRFVDVLARTVRARGAADRFACEAFVAAAGSLVSARIADGGDVRALRRPLLALARRLFGA